LAVLAAYLSALCDHPLTAGEVGVLLLIAPTSVRPRSCCSTSEPFSLARRLVAVRGALDGARRVRSPTSRGRPCGTWGEEGR
jgi:hypothetical protein